MVGWAEAVVASCSLVNAVTRSCSSPVLGRVHAACDMAILASVPSFAARRQALANVGLPQAWQSLDMTTLLTNFHRGVVGVAGASML